MLVPMSHQQHKVRQHPRNQQLNRLQELEQRVTMVAIVMRREVVHAHTIMALPTGFITKSEPKATQN